ncbi:unnamed protein product [Rhizoctonia solani]|uniref:Nephrocystin 3-like N-terminal domain-containing protein n=1 Tax=Rhizoctonia solani TaxID=456999 RepID=A0A8H3H5J0_9AGAM|nr:unnamed protein product [Rhizoctonia solani]
MSFRDKFRKFKSDTKSRIFQTNEAKDSTHTGPAQTSSTAPDRWIHLKTFLKTLEQATKSLPPLKAVVTELVACIDNHESVWRERKEYDILYHELEGLFQALQHHCNQAVSPTITTTVEALCQSIRDEISDIRKIQDKGKVREYLEAERDADAVLTRYRRIQGHLQRLSLNADISVWRIVDEIATDNRLRYLSPSLSACYNSAQAVELKRGPCTEGTRVDLLGQILGWIESSDSGSIYWMNGMAGTGKTTIAYSLCEELDTSYKLAASFFCSRLLPDCRNVNLIIPSIAFQLARSSRPFRFVLSRVLERDPDVHTRLPHLQFDSLISQPLLEVRNTLPEGLVVVIDALDECENKESTSRILEILLTKSANLPLKFIVSSRPEPEIRDEMIKQRDQAKSRVVLHELDKLTVQVDIERYLRSALAQVQPTEDQFATLVERAGILFIYAATVARYITHDRLRRNPRARLANVIGPSSTSKNKHKEIDELYTIILRAALDDPSSDKSEREDILHVLNSVICAQEPLTVDALSKLLKMNDSDRVRTSLRPLWSVLHISGVNERVTTLHASFPDYMLDLSRSKQYYCNSEAHNQTIVECCFDLFRNVRPQFNICSLESSYIADSQVEGLEERIKNVISTELFYASRCYVKYTRRMLRASGTAIGQRQLALLATWNFSDNTRSSAFSPDGTQIAVGVGTELRLLNLSTGRELLPPFRGHTHVIFSVQFSPDGSRIACGSFDGITVWNTRKGDLIIGPLTLDEISSSIISIAFSHDGARIVSGSSAGKIYIWDIQDGRCVGVLGLEDGYNHDVGIVKYSPGGNHLVSCIAGEISIREAHEAQVLRVLGLDSSPHYFRCADLSPDGGRIASVSEDGNIYIWDYGTGQVALGPLQVPGTGTSPQAELVTFSPDGLYIMSASRHGAICIWNAQNGDLSLGPLEGYTNLITSVCFSPDGAYFTSVSGLRTLRLWDTQTRMSALVQLEGHINSVVSVGFSPDATRIVSGFDDQTIYIRDIESGGITLGPLKYNNGYNMQTLLLPDGTFLLAATKQGTMLLDVHTGSVTLGPSRHYACAQSVEAAPDGTCIAFGSSDGIVRLLATDTYQTLLVIHKPLTDKVHGVASITFSPDSARIAVSFYPSSLVIYDARSGRLIHGPFVADVYERDSIKFSPESTRIAYRAESGILVKDLQGGEELFELPEIDTFTNDLIHFTPDGSRIVSSSSDGRICIWDARTGQLLLGPIKWHSDHVCSVALSSDGTLLVCGSYDNTIRVTDIRPVPAALDSSAHEYGEWEMREDGWVVDKLSRLLVWVPADLRATLMWPRTKLLISKNGYLRLNFEGACLGEKWTECYDPTQ